MKKILHIFGGMNIGGAELRTLEWMKAIDRSKYQFHFCSLSGKGTLDKEVENLGGKVFHINLSYGFSKRFLQLLSNEKYHVVHSHVYYFSGYILFLAYCKSVPVRIAHFRSSASYQTMTISRLFYIFFMKKIIKFCATHVCAVSKKALDSIWNVCEQNQRFFVVYSGFSFDVSLRDNLYVKDLFSIPKEHKIIIHVGSFRKEKNHLRLLYIFIKMLEKNHQLILMIVGKQDNDIYKQLQRVINEHQIEKNVIFTGVRRDILPLLSGSDLLLFPSKQEGLPGVVVEACEMLTPVLASDVGGIPEIESFFPEIVRSISLQRDNAIWCQEAFNKLANDSCKYKVKFTQTPFYLPTSVESICNIYETAE
ncbi:glycosyltransferase [Candidatus Uabimicrobium sp. HlEnr_7]|uniref:glycosyltransferase n=1 Tax=Candidatus Uabimicrobium helgolandensis TaxID=3095367 RepID=UPI0035586E5F